MWLTHLPGWFCDWGCVHFFPKGVCAHKILVVQTNVLWRQVYVHWDPVRCLWFVWNTSNYDLYFCSLAKPSVFFQVLYRDYIPFPASRIVLSWLSTAMGGFHITESHLQERHTSLRRALSYCRRIKFLQVSFQSRRPAECCCMLRTILKRVRHLSAQTESNWIQFNEYSGIGVRVFRVRQYQAQDNELNCPLLVNTKNSLTYALGIEEMMRKV